MLLASITLVLGRRESFRGKVAMNGGQRGRYECRLTFRPFFSDIAGGVRCSMFLSHGSAGGLQKRCSDALRSLSQPPRS